MLCYRPDKGIKYDSEKNSSLKHFLLLIETEYKIWQLFGRQIEPNSAIGEIFSHFLTSSLSAIIAPV